jgi:hypothetical protein
MSNQTYFEVSTQDEFATSLSQYMPGGSAFDAKNHLQSRMRKLLNGLSGEGIRAEQYIKDIADNHNINETVDYIEEWESCVGIPDSCFPGQGTIEERRRDVITKLARMNISTREELIALAAEYGYTIRIYSAIELSVFPMEFPYHFTGDGKTNRFTIYVEFSEVDSEYIFPVTFPWKFAPSSLNIVQCMFNKIVAANVRIIYVFAGDKPPPQLRGFPVAFPWSF